MRAPNNGLGLEFAASLIADAEADIDTDGSKISMIHHKMQLSYTVDI